MKKVINRGFTLIELLVVIAIIGILASIVLVSLNSARNKGKDTRIISDVNQVRTQIESEANSGGTYQVGASNCITALVASNGATVSGSGNCGTLATDASNNGGGITVKTNGAAAATSFSSYVIYSALASNGSNYYCIDSTGNAKTETTAWTSGFVCW